MPLDILTSESVRLLNREIYAASGIAVTDMKTSASLRACTHSLLDMHAASATEVDCRIGGVHRRSRRDIVIADTIAIIHSFIHSAQTTIFEIDLRRFYIVSPIFIHVVQNRPSNVLLRINPASRSR